MNDVKGQEQGLGCEGAGVKTADEGRKGAGVGALGEGYEGEGVRTKDEGCKEAGIGTVDEHVKGQE